jgi:hypothetical protein
MYGPITGLKWGCWKTQCVEEDLKFHNTELTTEVLPRAEESECNLILSRSVVFLNLYDAIANNGILDCIERNTPIIVNRSASSEEYLGKDYPLFYESNNSYDEILKLFSDENILKGHKYLCNLNKSKLNIDIFIKSIKDIIQNI